jgi:peptide deformylase
MILEIKKYPDPILKRKAEAIKEITLEIKELILKMKETMTNPEVLKDSLKKGSSAAGLAANQVGVPKRLIVVNTGKELKAFINPEITEKGSQTNTDLEGCLSFPGVWLEIKRANWIKVKTLNEEGASVELRAEKFLARIFQHEIDHLNGILFFERLGLIKRLKIQRQLNKASKNP